MAVMAHNHDWTAVQGGYRCQGCSAAMTDATVGANAAPASAQNQTDVAQDAWVSAGGVA